MSSVLIEVSSLPQLINVRSILAEGLIPEKRKVLLLSDNTKYPEAWSALHEGIREKPELVEGFDKVVNYNELIYPYHPAQLSYSKANSDYYIFLKKMIGEEHFTRLLVESIQVNPALFLCQIYSEAAIDVFADGLMVYSPTRDDLPENVLTRINRLYYVDYLDGIKPYLLMEANPEYIAIPRENLLKNYKLVGKPVKKDKKIILIIGQYLTDLGIVTRNEEYKLYLDILKREYEQFGDEYRYIFRPHPAASPAYADTLVEFAAENIINLEIDNNICPVECLYNAQNTFRVTGIFSTTLFSMTYLYDCHAQSFFADEIYRRLTPLANSNHVPAMLCYICFDINLKEQKFARQDIAFALLLYSCATHPERFREIYFALSPELLINKLENYQELLKYDFISIPLKKITEDYKKENSGKEKSLSGREQKEVFDDLRQKAEEAIKQRDYLTARQYFMQALAIFPRNTKCVKRLNAITSPSLIRPFMLLISNRYR